jgi:exocyst complex component 4
MGALADLKAYLVSQETVSAALLHVTDSQTLADILVEELHSHIYLKTFYSDSRWRPYFPGQQSRRCFLPSRRVDIQCHWICNPKILRLHTHQLLHPPPRHLLSPRRPRCPVARRFLHPVPDRPHVSSASYPHWPSSQVMIRCSTTSDVAADPVSTSITHRRVGSNAMGQAASSNSLSSFLMVGAPDNPETDSFAYIETLLEALAVLGRLGAALETFAQRVPGEAHALVEATLDEVEERWVIPHLTKRADDLQIRGKNRRTRRGRPTAESARHGRRTAHCNRETQVTVRALGNH